MDPNRLSGRSVMSFLLKALKKFDRGIVKFFHRFSEIRRAQSAVLVGHREDGIPEILQSTCSVL